MMNARTLALCAILLAACHEAPTPPAAADDDMRPAIAVEYVRNGSDATVLAHPHDGAPAIGKVGSGQSVSVLSRRGEWTEVRIADRSGWVRAAQLSDAAEAKQAESDNLKPSFRIPPAPVTSPGAHGDIVLEASVNQDGEVLDVRALSDTTGSASLLTKNRASLMQARFNPIVQHGARKAFTYEYRVHY